MQRAAAGLAYRGGRPARRDLRRAGAGAGRAGRQRRRRPVRRARCWRGGARRCRRSRSPTRCTRPARRRSGAPAAAWSTWRPGRRYAGLTWSSTGSSASVATRASGRRAVEALARGRGRAGRRGRHPQRGRRRHRPARGRPRDRGRHRHLRHPQDLPPRRARARRPAESSSWSTSASTCPPPPSPRCRPTTWPPCSRGPRSMPRSTPAASSASAPARPAIRARACSRPRARRAGWPAWSATSVGQPDAVRAAHPEVVVGDGRVQAWVVGSGGDAEAAEALAEALKDDVPLVVDADALAHLPARLDRPALLTPHAGELAAMLGVDRAEVEADQLAFARRAARRVGGDGPAQGSPHPRRRARRAGPGHHRRHLLAGRRRRRRRAGRALRSPAGRRPLALRRGVGRARGCTAPPRPGPRVAARSPPRRWRPAIAPVVAALLA